MKRLLVIVAIAVLGLGMLTQVQPAHAATGTTTSSTSSTSSTPCHVFHIQLNGDKTPKMTCADTQTLSKGISPYASIDGGCSGSDLWWYAGLNQTGDRLCISGTGDINLFNYTDPNQCFLWICNIWGKIVQSYWAGTYPGNYRNPSTGDLFYFTAWQAANIPIDQGTNDVSWVHIGS